MDGVRQRGTSLIAGEDAKRAVDGKPSGFIVGMPSGKVDRLAATLVTSRVDAALADWQAAASEVPEAPAET